MHLIAMLAYNLPIPVTYNFNSMLTVGIGITTLMLLTLLLHAYVVARRLGAETARLTSVLAHTNAVLQKRNQELDQFAYVVSHDLKAPLRAIANLSEWIEEDLSDTLTQDTQHQMDLLRGRVHRMEALINGLLQYSCVGRFERSGGKHPSRISVRTGGKVELHLAEVSGDLSEMGNMQLVVCNWI